MAREERERRRRKRRLGGGQMEVGESRNKRYVNPRNGAVYSSHKKANKTFFRSGSYTPQVPPLLTPRFRSPPLGSFLPPEKWQKINRRSDKECETRTEVWREGCRSLSPSLFLSLLFPSLFLSSLSSYSPSRHDGFPEAERNRSTYCPELISRPASHASPCTNRFLLFFFFFPFGLDSEAARYIPFAVISMSARVTNEPSDCGNFREMRKNGGGVSLIGQLSRIAT